MHLHLLPVALPLVWRGARLLTMLMGIEAWTTLDVLQKAAIRRAWRVVAISTHTAERFRTVNPCFADMPISVCHPGVPSMPRGAAGPIEGRYALIGGSLDAGAGDEGGDTLIEMWPC